MVIFLHRTFYLFKENGEIHVFGNNEYGELGLGDTQKRTTPQLLMKDENILLGTNLEEKENSQINFPKQLKLLQEHLFEMNTIESGEYLKVECGNQKEMKISSFICNKVFSEKKHWKTEKELKKEIFSMLSSEKSIKVVSKYIHCFVVKTEEIENQVLLEVLQFCFQIGIFNKFKAKIGEELEKRMKEMKLKSLGELLQKSNDMCFNEMSKWLLFNVLERKPSEKEMASLEIPYKVFMMVPHVSSQSHLKEIFSDVLCSSLDRIESETAEDKLSFVDLMEFLWNEKEESGDYIVKSKEDGQERKFHKMILSFLPFFLSQNESSLMKDKNKHTTLLSTKAFEAFAEFIYLSKTEQFDASLCLELVDKENGVHFYYSGESELEEFLQKIMEGKRIVNENNWPKVLLKSSKSGAKQLVEESKKFVLENPESFQQLNNLSPEDKLIILTETVQLLLERVKQLETKK